MAVPRVLSQSRSFLSRGFTASRIVPVTLRSARPAFSNRLFTSSASFQETEQTPAAATEVPSKVPSTSTPDANASIALFKINLRASKAEVEDFIRSKGFEIKRTQIGLNRFTFQNGGKAFIELANAKQAQEAVERLNNQAFKGLVLDVKPLASTFVWGSRPEGRSLTAAYVHDEGNNAAEALKPLLEGRRFMLQVQTPGWPRRENESSNKAAQRIVIEHMGSFGIESIGDFRPFHGDRKPHPRMLCMIDFATQEGAEKAVEAINDTIIEGRKTILCPSNMAPWRAHQVGKVSPDLLKQLQEKDLAPLETYEDKFTIPRS